MASYVQSVVSFSPNGLPTSSREVKPVMVIVLVGGSVLSFGQEMRNREMIRKKEKVGFMGGLGLVKAKCFANCFIYAELQILQY